MYMMITKRNLLHRKYWDDYNNKIRVRSMTITVDKS